MSKQMQILGSQLRKVIGKHNRMNYMHKGTSDLWHEAQRESDNAERLVRYLVQVLDNRHHAVVLASAAGCPGYINYR